MSKENDVRQASAKFYAALTSMANGDPAPMVDAWSKSDHATAQHPIGGRDLGSREVLGSFAKVAEIASSGKIGIADQRLDVSEDTAIETGWEKGTATIAGQEVTIDQRVLNVYRLEDGSWKIRHHHADISPAMLDILAKLGG